MRRLHHPAAAVDADRRPTGLELPVRMGISAGEAELRGRTTSVRCSTGRLRLMAAGHGGQVLLTDSTAALLATSI